MKKVALALLWLVSVAVAAVVSAHFAVRNTLPGFALELDATQAMLGFNHLLRYRELETYLSKGCNDEALEKARISRIKETALLQSFIEEHPQTWVTKYISDRDPNLIPALKEFKDPYGSSWQEPQCIK